MLSGLFLGLVFVFIMTSLDQLSNKTGLYLPYPDSLPFVVGRITIITASISCFSCPVTSDASRLKASLKPDLWLPLFLRKWVCQKGGFFFFFLKTLKIKFGLFQIYPNINNVFTSRNTTEPPISYFSLAYIHFYRLISKHNKPATTAVEYLSVCWYRNTSS